MDQQRGNDQQPVAKRTAFGQLRGLRWWQVVLSLLPLGLIPIGGLIGGLIGGVGFVVNLALARRQMGTAPKALAMVGVVAACYLIDIVVAGFLYSLTH
jgi:hypothetical protein